MDEILYPSLSREEQPVSEKEQLTWSQRLEALRRRADDLLIRFDAFRQRHTLRPKAFLAAALLLGTVTTAATVYTTGYAVDVDGQELGVVANTAQFETIKDRVENRVSQILDREYTLDGHVNYSRRIVEKNKLSSMAGFETYLFNQVDEITRAYVLTVDGQTLTVQADNKRLDAMLDELRAPYVNANTIYTEFTVPVAVSYEYVGLNDLQKNLDEVEALLRSNTVEAVTYTVQQGDTYYGIAQRHDMTVDELMDMNPQASLKRLMIGDELTVSENVPYLGVRTVDQVTYQEAIPAPIEYREDDTMYQGDTKTLDAGAEGLAQVDAKITYLNGREKERDVTRYQELVAPKTKIVAKGTKERPKTMPKGYFIWPVRGVITSGYGGRSLFGTYNYHGGIDIACRYGTPIKAADGGTVITSEWHPSYGYYVVISHGNGKTTYYAHNSSLLVHVGEKVYQGQAIAKAGSTGNSTGVHCHFEVRVNGVRQSPRSYLP